ncbi:DUF1992 domain-containing protein [Microbacterium oryzae]|uniref:DnaJ family domain-containing protein n=1 Tax=Microbacterium oryzae TaxID=743009 RepID=UPI0025B04691|nr:DUF1992 domain-containing protein [Microbacterium oryzae]MDN3309367.1 DUF1992 domain-containing protein [Microbacterium oryzae]
MAARDEEHVDPRLSAVQYRIDRMREELGETDDTPTGSAGAPGLTDRPAYVEMVIQQAMRRGEFDDLPGAGRPLEGLGESHDPDWWIRRKIEREGLTGLGPPALQLRSEHAGLAQTLDTMSREQDVREHLDDFNRRVKLARMQLLGGPPVVTPLVDIDAEVAGWAARREERRQAARAVAAPEQTPRRRRLRRRRGADGR